MNNAWESYIPYSNPNIYARHRARRRHRDSDRRPLDSIGNPASLAADILICLITFHCYLTSDPDYFRGADQFPDYFPS